MKKLDGYTLLNKVRAITFTLSAPVKEYLFAGDDHFMIVKEDTIYEETSILMYKDIQAVSIVRGKSNLYFVCLVLLPLALLLMIGLFFKATLPFAIGGLAITALLAFLSLWNSPYSVLLQTEVSSITVKHFGNASSIAALLDAIKARIGEAQKAMAAAPGNGDEGGLNPEAGNG